VIRAVLFDFGGTLFSYETLMPSEMRNMLELVSSAGIDASVDEIARAQRETGRIVMREYMQRPFYLHRDMFRDSLRATLEALGGTLDDGLVDRHRERQWELHGRDFELRPRVIETLQALRERRVHVGMVSNIDDDQLEHLLGISGIEPHFDAILSSESARSCKPHGSIFHQALESAESRPDETLFVGDSRSADVAGANAAGLRSVLLWQREDRPPPNDDPRPHHVIRQIPDVLELLS
jgi:2-haloalkanoic acid dehalogenase type II